MARAKQNPSAGVWIAAAFGAVAVGGVLYVVTRPKAAASPALASTTDGGTLGPSNLTICEKANALAALASTSANPAGELAAYNVYAAQCRAAGGNPNPFPGA